MHRTIFSLLIQWCETFYKQTCLEFV